MTAKGAEANARDARTSGDQERADSRCHYDTERGMRVLDGRHAESCTGCESCAGCQPCTRAHCMVCTREHVQQHTCARCIGRVRADLVEVVRLYHELRFALLNHNRANAEIPGGLAQVLLGPYSEGRAALHLALTANDWTELDEDGIGPEPPLLVLASWEDDWRREFDHRAAQHRATITNASGYLQRHLDHAAQRHLAFDEFARDVRTTRARLQHARDDADPTVHGVACFDCGHDLCQTFDEPAPCDHEHAPCGCDQGGRRDTWQCMRCGRTYTEHDYRRAVRQAHIEQEPWRRPSEVHAITGVPEKTLRRWARAGHISRRTGERIGWTLYHVNEVRRHAMRGRLLA